MRAKKQQARNKIKLKISSWKKTLGPIEDRPGHAGCWSYRLSDGMGLLEFLEWCEDMHAEPVLAVYASYSLNGEHIKAGPDLEPVVKETLDEIEYVIGDTNTTLGAHRAKDGHPTPFKLNYIGTVVPRWRKQRDKTEIDRSRLFLRDLEMRKGGGGTLPVLSVTSNFFHSDVMRQR